MERMYVYMCVLRMRIQIAYNIYVMFLSQFDYEEFLTQQLEKGEIFSLLEVLKVRNLKIPLPLTPQMEDYCK